jgi:hypothetical protein
MNEDDMRTREICLTNQDGVVCYATCYEYFIDLWEIEQEVQNCGLLEVSRF